VADRIAAAEAQLIAERSVEALYARDRASQSLGMSVTAVRPGFAQVTMPVRADMVNGHGLCHGGLIFALGDSAFAFACNTYDEATVGAAASIDFLAAGRAGDTLTAEARELWRTRRNGLYEIVILDGRGERLALLRGRSYRIDGPVVPAE
jgi:acyl-CoA thioesterase